MKKTLMTVASVLVIAVSNGLQAEERGRIGMGINLSNKLDIYNNADSDAIAGVHFQYRGKRLNIDEETIAYTLSDTEKYQIELMARSENRGLEQDYLTDFTGLKERDESLDAGFRAGFKTQYGLLSVEATGDITGTHNGQEVDIRFGPDFYQKAWNGKREVSIGALAGVKWQSKDVVDYYYGVSTGEATASRAAYNGEDAVTPYVGMEAKANLSKRFSMHGNVLYKDRPDEITNSPLVNKSNDGELNLAVTYWF
ncbi:MAG: Unknown protein [uncultured Thiotrichaceae bacterium]|uniref:Outer membrane protein n=1 Tax=uncultured Thiotrichaceae bacterium TaxID=298394 RepID=A0A6S6RYP6_9GAMM|nr:MAG: Unknown protein [uncultured Thiotrichaceae bacterium]